MRNTIIHLCTITFVITALLLGVSGCSRESLTDVTGVVKYNGAPLTKPDGKIVFVSPAGTQIIASLELDGHYRATGVATGLNRVAVYYPNPEAQSSRHFPTPPKPGQTPAPQRPTSVPPFLTPYKYATFDTSDLSVQVEPGCVFNVDLAGPRIP
jgi:hypothetical protein